MSSSEQTASEAKADRIAKMGIEVGSIYDALWQQLALIHRKWAEYVALFGTDSSRIELLNSAAPRLFRTIQDSLWDDVLLHLARLTDPPKSGGKSNLSVRRLAEVLAASPAGPRVVELTDIAIRATEFARDSRNRRLAHSDLDLALGEHVAPLLPASRAAVKSALAALTDVLNEVSLQHLNSTTFFGGEAEHADAVSLLHLLRRGLLDDAERRARIRRGEFNPQDLHPDPV